MSRIGKKPVSLPKGVEASISGQTVTVKGPKGTRAFTATDDVTIAIDDDGHGIAPEDQQRIFERFVRLDESRNRSNGGVGLGLPIVEELVENHGGEVRVEASERLGGARFVVTLPDARVR